MAEVEWELVDSGRTNRLELKLEEEDIQVISKDDNSGTERNAGILRNEKRSCE